MKQNMAQLVCTLIVLGIVTGSAWASQVDLEPAQVNLVTDFGDLTYVRDYGFIPMPTPNDNVQGPYRINLKGIGEKKELEINFQAMNPEVYALMANQLALQYCILSDGHESQWSEWNTLSQLPLKIKLRDQKPHSLTNPQGVTILLMRLWS